MDSSEVRRALFGSEALPRLPPRVTPQHARENISPYARENMSPYEAAPASVGKAPRRRGGAPFRDRTNSLDQFGAAYGVGPGGGAQARECYEPDARRRGGAAAAAPKPRSARAPSGKRFGCGRRAPEAAPGPRPSSASEAKGPRRVIVAYGSPERDALECANGVETVGKKALSPSARRRARRKARKLDMEAREHRSSSAWKSEPYASPSRRARLVEPYASLATPVAVVTPESLGSDASPGEIAARTPVARRNHRRRHSERKRRGADADGGLVLTSLTPGSEERERKAAERRRRDGAPRPPGNAAAVSPDELPPMAPFGATPGARLAAAPSPAETVIVDPSPGGCPSASPPAHGARSLSPESPDEAGAAVAPAFAEDALMRRCVTRTKLLEYLDDDGDDDGALASPPTLESEDDEAPWGARPAYDRADVYGGAPGALEDLDDAVDARAAEDGDAVDVDDGDAPRDWSLTLRGGTIDEHDPAWSWRYDFMAEPGAAPRGGDDDDDDDDALDSPPLRRGDDSLEDGDPFAAPPGARANLGATFAGARAGPPAGGARFDRGLGHLPLAPLPEERPLLIDAQGVPLLDAQAVDLCTERLRKHDPATGAPRCRPAFRRKVRAAATSRRASY